jgi:sulfite reductase alpha subunit-like flavoprotein
MSQQPNRPSAEQMAKFKKNANDSSLSAEVRAKFKAIVDKFENVTEEVGEDVVKEVEPAKKRGRKPRATSTTTKTTKTKQSATDVEKAKAEIKKRKQVKQKKSVNLSLTNIVHCVPKHKKVNVKQNKQVLKTRIV